MSGSTTHQVQPGSDWKSRSASIAASTKIAETKTLSARDPLTGSDSPERHRVDANNRNLSFLSIFDAVRGSSGSSVPDSKHDVRVIDHPLVTHIHHTGFVRTWCDEFDTRSCFEKRCIFCSRESRPFSILAIARDRCDERDAENDADPCSPLVGTLSHTDDHLYRFQPR